MLDNSATKIIITQKKLKFIIFIVVYYKLIMDYQYYLNNKNLPTRNVTSSNVHANSNTNHANRHQSGQVIGYVFQNVIIGGGMMTRKVPVIANSQSSSFVSPVALVGGGKPVIIGNQSHSSRQSSSFVPPVNLIGVSSSKIVQAPTQQNDWRSSGTIIIDDAYNRRNGKTCQAIFLGLNPNTGIYELFYGKRDRIDNSAESTALRETREESANMFVFSSRVYNDKYKVCSSNAHHHAFVVRVSAPRGGIKSSVFVKNYQTLKKNKAPCEWTELAGITRIDINDAINSNILSHTRGDFKMFDVYGNSINIFSRDVEFIASALRKSMHMRGDVHQLSYVNTWDDSRVGGTKMYLNGTACYKT